MKLELDLLREILLYVEEHGARPYNDLENIKIDGWSDDEITYHVVIADEDGLLKATVEGLPDDEDPSILHLVYSVHRLTSRGHELIGAIREPKAWNVVKTGLGKVGSVTVNAVFGVAEAYLKQKIVEYSGMNLS